MGGQSNVRVCCFGLDAKRRISSRIGRLYDTKNKYLKRVFSKKAWSATLAAGLIKLLMMEY